MTHFASELDYEIYYEKYNNNHHCEQNVPDKNLHQITLQYKQLYFR